MDAQIFMPTYCQVISAIPKDAIKRGKVTRLEKADFLSKKVFRFYQKPA